MVCAIPATLWDEQAWILMLLLRSGNGLLLCAVDCLADKDIALLTCQGAVVVLDVLSAEAVSASLTCKCPDFASLAIKSGLPQLCKELAMRRVRCEVILTEPLQVRQITDVSHPCD